MLTGLQSFDQYYFAVAVVIGTYAAASMLLWLAQRSRYAERIRSFRGIAQNFLTVINVLFALNLAFLANDTWVAHDRALNAVYQEAGSLRSILDVGKELPESEREMLSRAVEDYARLTVDEEWPLLARRQSSEKVAVALDHLLSLLADHGIAFHLTTGVQSVALNLAVQVRNDRDLRLALSRTHVNPLKWLGMAFLGFLTMVSIALVHVDQPSAEIAAVLLFATAAAPTAAIILIHGNPFQHPMALSPAPIAALVGMR